MKTEQLILSIGTILLVARVFGWFFQRIGQPRVVGEMTAGIVLGPSLFGRFFPDAFALVFPASSMPAITVLSQLGLLLFMFVVGLEVDLKRILEQRTAVVLISNISIVLPLALGVGLARALYPEFAVERGAFFPFALFIGTAMSITAFPVLARILKERNLLGTDLGSMAISCAQLTMLVPGCCWPSSQRWCTPHKAGIISRLGCSCWWHLSPSCWSPFAVRRSS